MDATERERLAALAEAATPGPWGYLFAGKNRFTTPVDIDVTEADWGGENLREYSLSCSDDRNAWRAADAEFIAAAREAVPALLAALAEAEAEVERLQGAVWASEEIDRRAGLLAPTEAERDRYRRQVEAVRALHVDRHVYTSDADPIGGYVCAECGAPTESEPCATVRALDGAES